MAKQTGVSIARYFPYWEVVERQDGQFVVVDTSVTPPLQVYGPVVVGAARAWAKQTAILFLALHGDYSDTGSGELGDLET